MLPEWAAHSLVAQQICSADFPYLQPWFYNHPYALRCELAVGKSRREQIDSAIERAWHIFEILFENGVDAVFFDQWLEDATLGDQLDSPVKSIFCSMRSTFRRLMLLHKWMKYPFFIVRGLGNAEADPSLREYRNRIVCHVTDEEIDFAHLIDKQASAKPNSFEPLNFVSFKNECILSIYSHLGCDIVFSSKGKMQRFFPLLKPYLFDYDMEEMLRRTGARTPVSAEDSEGALPF